MKFLQGPVYAIRLPLRKLEGCTVLLLSLVLAVIVRPFLRASACAGRVARRNNRFGH